VGNHRVRPAHEHPKITVISLVGFDGEEYGSISKIVPPPDVVPIGEHLSGVDDAAMAQAQEDADLVSAIIEADEVGDE
jgi:hypothetical protein